MQAQITKWGNSLGVRIPKTIARKLYFKEGAVVNLQVFNNNLVITPETSELDTLLNSISNENRHHEVFNQDKKSGNESW